MEIVINSHQIRIHKLMGISNVNEKRPNLGNKGNSSYFISIYEGEVNVFVMGMDYILMEIFLFMEEILIFLVKEIEIMNL